MPLFLILPSKQRKCFRFNWNHAEKGTGVREALKVVSRPMPEDAYVIGHLQITTGVCPASPEAPGGWLTVSELQLNRYGQGISIGRG